MMDAEYSEPNGKYESSTYVTVFRDIDFIQVQHMFYDSNCMWVRSQYCPELWIPAKSHGCKYTEKRQNTLGKKVLFIGGKKENLLCIIV